LRDRFFGRKLSTKALQVESTFNPKINFDLVTMSLYTRGGGRVICDIFYLVISDMTLDCDIIHKESVFDSLISLSKMTFYFQNHLHTKCFWAS